MQHHHTHHAQGGTTDLFPRETEGLSERVSPQVVELADGDEVDLRIAPVAAGSGTRPCGCSRTTGRYPARR